MARTVPLQRLGRPEEHAWLVALLCSPLGRAFNGSTVTLDGARDNWFGPWPPPGLAEETGEVPTEAGGGLDWDRGRAMGFGLSTAGVLGGRMRSACGRSVVVAQKPSKLLGRVRFPSPA